MSKKHHILYAIIKKDDGRYYVGQHITSKENPMSEYWGSGKKLREAYKQYGKDAFVKVVLAEVDNPEQLQDLERRVVNEQMINDPMCYNENKGGGTSYGAVQRNTSWFSSPEGRAHMKHMSDLAKDPDAIRRRVESTKTTIAMHPEIKQKRIEKLKETTSTTEYKEKRSNSTTDWFKSEAGIKARLAKKEWHKENRERSLTNMQQARNHITKEGLQRSADNLREYTRSHRAEIDERTRRYYQSDEGKAHIKKIVELSHTEEARRKSSESHKTYFQTEEGKKHLEKAHAAANTPEARAKQRETTKRNELLHPERSLQRSKLHQEIANRPGQREKMSTAITKVYNSERGAEIKARISASLKQYYANKKKGI